MKVSVIVPCYNQAQYLDDALQSVLKQTYKDWECIIVNDGSTDHTEEVANTFLKLDNRFKYIDIKNGGVSHARNVGIKEANGDYILPLDADDKIAPSYIELGLKEFDKDNALKVVYCEAKFFGKYNKLWKLPNYSFRELLRNNIIFCSALIKKDDFVKSGGYDINLSIGLEDWEFWINFLKDGGKVYRIPKVCFYYRIKETSRNVEISENDFEEVLKYISIKHSELYVHNFGSFPSLLEQNKELLKKNKRLTKANKANIVQVLKRLKKYFYG
ncbi:glycosyltransferase [Gaetbulibacter sp. M235]|uniref:glycosyltransferase family 2 protein n=1 Tax=Gaetbulibacter sp. M235 TaxID=3126510 RepID=UPI00374FA892